MKISTITNTNQKGQIVIPKKFRDKLNITADMPLHVTLKDEGIFISPLSKPVLTQIEKNKAFLKVLKMTQGILAGEEWDPKEKERRKLELASSQKNKKAW